MKSYEEYYTELMNSIFHGKKKKSNSIWAVGFFILLIVNVIFVSPVVQLAFDGAAIGLGIIGVIPYLFVFSLINFIAVLFYIITHHLQGIARGVSDAVLVVTGFIIMVLGIMSHIVLCSPGCF